MTRSKIRNLMLYPAELRVRARNASISGALARMGIRRRQGPRGTKGKNAAHCGTLTAHSAAQRIGRAITLPIRAILSLPLLIGFILVGRAYDRENKRRWGR